MSRIMNKNLRKTRFYKRLKTYLIIFLLAEGLRRFFKGEISQALLISGWNIYLTNNQMNYLYYGLFCFNLILFVICRDRKKSMEIEHFAWLSMFPVTCLYALLAWKHTAFLWNAVVIIHVCLFFHYLSFYRRKLRIARLKGKRLKKGRVMKRYIISWMSTGFMWVYYAALMSYAICAAFSRDVWQETNIKANITTETFDCYYQDHIRESVMYDMLVDLHISRYKELSEQERLNQWQILVDIEAGYLQLGYVPVYARYMENSNRTAYYNPETNSITLSRSLLEDDAYMAVVLHSVLHEMYHAYQYAYVTGESVNLDMLGSEDNLEQWIYEFENYKSTNGWDYEKSLKEYKDQGIEQTANAYASERIRTYAILFK